MQSRASPLPGSPRLGSSGTTTRGKGMSPLPRVYNSPDNNNYVQVDQSSSLALPAIEDLLEEFQKDEYGGAYSPCFDMSNMASVSLDGLRIWSSSSSSALCGSMNEEPSFRLSKLSQEGNNMCQASCVTANTPVAASTGPVPLSLQLQQERHQEKQYQQQHLNNLTGPSNIPMGSEQVPICRSISQSSYTNDVESAYF